MTYTMTILAIIFSIILIIVGLSVLIRILLVVGDILSSEDSGEEIIGMAFGLFGAALLIGLGVKLLIPTIKSLL